MAPPLGIYGWSPGQGGVHFHRIGEPIRVLAEWGNTATSGVEIHDGILERHNTILGHTLHTPAALEVWETLERAGDHKLILDVDDAMWVPDWAPFAKHYTPDVLARLYRIAELSHVITCTSEAIADHFAKLNANVHVVPNTVPQWLIDWSMPGRDRPTLGYQGSPSHLPDWTRAARRQLQTFLKERPGWGLQWMGTDPGPLRDRIGVRVVGWRNPGADYYQSISMDVGIGPLRNTPFNNAKSSLRAVEYAALGVVAVLPDLPIYRNRVETGVTGILYPLVRNGMLDALRSVAADPVHTDNMGAEARRRAQAWTTEASISNWVTAWDSQ